MGIDDERRSRRHVHIVSSSSSAAIGVDVPPSRSRRKCRGANNIQKILIFLMLGTAASVFVFWEIMSTMLHWYALDPVEQYHAPVNGNGVGHINSYYNNKFVSGSINRRSYDVPREIPTNVVGEGGRKNAIDTVGAIVSGHDVALPLPTYTSDMASDAIRPAPWMCGSNDFDSDDRRDEENDIQSSTTTSSSERHIFSFVHVYKAAGSTIRTFFREYSDMCHKSWMLLVSCKEHLNPSPPSSISIRALEAGKGEDTYWKGCRIKEMYVRPNDLINDNSMLHEDSIDIYGGHFRIGIVGTNHSFTSQQSSPSPTSTAIVRHIVFLRDPMARFVSGILFQHQKSALFDGTLDGAVQRIKKNVRGSRKKQEYWIRSLDYLLTPSQASYFAKRRKTLMSDITNTTVLGEKVKSMADIESRTAIQNLAQYNVIVGMAEQMYQSMAILRHILVPPADRSNQHHMSAFAGDDDADTTTSPQERQNKIHALFNTFGGSSSTAGVAPGEGVAFGDDKKESTEDIRMNASGQEGVTTELVLEELKRDATFLPMFVEYVKYEQRIHDYALGMHQMQYREALVNAGYSAPPVS